MQVQECREAAEGLQALLQQGVFVDAAAAPADAVAELQGMMEGIAELQVRLMIFEELCKTHCLCCLHHIRSRDGVSKMLQCESSRYMKTQPDDMQVSAQQCQANQAANGLPLEPFEALDAAWQEATWRLQVWSSYQAVADKMSAVTTSPILSNIDNQVSACRPSSWSFLCTTRIS